MTRELVFSIFGAGVILTLLIGLYCIVTTRNLVRSLLGLELLTKGVTLLLVVCGYVVGQIALAQALAVTLIVIEVSVIVVAASVVVCVHRRTDSIDARELQEVKG